MEEKEAIDIDEIHKGTREIIKKLSEICDMLGVEYYVTWGSLIGAVRHKGFIPWDDDFDVIMMRPDYDKFLDYCEKNEKALYPFKIFNRDVCPEYPYTISRFEDMRYKAVYDNIIEYDSGMFIDIYPFDGAGTDEEQTRKKLERKRNLLAKFVAWSIRKEYTKSESNNFIFNIAKYIAFSISHLIGKDYFLDQYEKLKDTYSFEDSTLVGCLCWGKGIYVFDKSLFEKSILVPFEDIMVKIPIGYEAILRQTYGDYMELPEEEERVATHEYMLYKR